MRIFAPLRHRPIATLWSGQLLSSLGDEVNRVATIWLAAQLWGAAAGRLLALHALCACVSGLAVGAWVDRLSLRRVLISADVARALAVLLVPLGAGLGVPLAPLLLASVATCASLSAVFDPALRALTTEMVPAPALRGATNALMESTLRFARVLGPALVTALAGVVPTLQFFTLDAASFALSAASIAWLAYAARVRHHESLRASATSDPAARPSGALREIAADPTLRYAVASGALVGAAWWLLLPLGLELLLAQRGATDVAALAGVMSAYGAGNLASNLVVGNFADRHPERLLFGGRVVAGLGFLVCALVPGRAALLGGAALAAAGGPLTDVGFMGLLQARFPAQGLARVYRANLALNYGVMFALFLASPLLFRALGAAHVVLAAALTIGACGAWGLVRYRPAASAHATAST